MAERNGAAASRWVPRLVVIGYVGLLVVWPVGLIARSTFDDGLAGPLAALSDPIVTHALQM
ncbi:MAG: hypothetical protein ACRDPI_01780, partial [Nocardioidaceae bacterium]